MNNINRNSGDNTGGHKVFLFIPVEDVSSIPKAEGMIVVEDIVLKEDKAWYSGLFTNDTHGYVETQDEGEAGTYYKKNMTGFVPTVNEAMNALLEDCENRRFIIVTHDNNERLRILGSLEEPMKLTADENSQNVTSGRGGYSVSFFRDSSFKSYFYEPVTPINWDSYLLE